MCGPYEYGEAVAPEKRIADAFRAELNVIIDPQALRLFIRHNWNKLAPLAHKIHEGTS